MPYMDELESLLTKVLKVVAENPSDMLYIHNLMYMLLDFSDAVKVLMDGGDLDIFKKSPTEVTKDILDNIFKTGEGNNDK